MLLIKIILYMKKLTILLKNKKMNHVRLLYEKQTTVNSLTISVTQLVDRWGLTCKYHVSLL